jgi:DNA helicase II / ATP-dependent DNA helicase PcrA
MFNAKFPGKCSVCSSRIAIGDPISLNDSRKALCSKCSPESGTRSRSVQPESKNFDFSSRPARSPISVLIGGSGPKVAFMAFNRHNAEQIQEILGGTQYFEGSDEQKSIWAEMLTGDRNILINACAGGAKTSTAQQGILRLIRDQDASAIASTYHSLGYSICRKNFPWLAGTKPNQYKLQDLLKTWEKPVTRTEDTWQFILRATEKLVRLCKSYLLDGTDKSRLEQLADFFDIDLGTEEQIIYSFVPKAIQAALDDTTQVDFQDMIFIPSMLNLSGDTYDLLICDEAQDVSPDQRKLFQLACPSGRIMAVGDSWQCLYSWRGADLDSMEQLEKMLGESPRGVVKLPLTLTRRCPKGHVRLAQAISGPGVIEALPDAPEGIIRQLTQHKALEEMHAGDMVLCRVNKHLIPTAYQLIKRGVKAIVRGRDIGAGLEALIKKLMGKYSLDSDIARLTSAIYDWRRKEIAKLRPLGEKAIGRIQQIEDRADTLLELCEDADTVQEVIKKINQIFADFDDDGKPVSAVVLGTIHKLKGLQSDRIFVLAPELLPHPMSGPNFYKGELCALYVAVTRAKWGDGKEGELIFVGEIPELLNYYPSESEITKKELEQVAETGPDLWPDDRDQASESPGDEEDEGFWDSIEPPGGWQGATRSGGKEE